MRILIALAILVSVIAGTLPAQAQEEVGPVYQEEDYASFGLNEPGLDEGSFSPLYRKLPSTPGGKPAIACTWDDGSSAVTLVLLSVLDQFPDVHCTFFVNGREAVPGTFQRILDSGHAIASHGINHLALAGQSCEAIRQQILAIEPFVNARIREPITIKAYRPPFGDTNDAVRSCMAGVGYDEVLWSIDTRDWTYPGVAYILDQLNNAVDGDVILQHDSANKEASVEAFRRFLVDYHDDYQFVLIPGSGRIDQPVELPWDAGPACVGPNPCEQIGFADSNGWFEQRQGLGTDALGQNGFYYGNPGDVAFMGDWDCNGTDTPGLYRQSDGYVYLRNSNTQGVADLSFYFGNPGDIPLAGDWNGDGCDTVSIYRRSEGRVYIINRLGDGDSGLGAAEYSFFFGNPVDKPFGGDFDGNGVDTVGLHRESTGFVYLRNSNSQGVADLSFYFGDPGDKLIAADWDGNGTDTVAVFRPSGSAWYFKLSNSDGVADHAIAYGNWTIQPLAGTFS